MNNYTVCNLYSGSKGNSTFICADGVKILIDAGKSAKTLISVLNQIGESIDEIDAIFITHEHNDHISAIQTLSHKKKIPIHITLGSAYKFKGLKDEALCSCLYIHENSDFSVQIGSLTVTAFPTPHDSRSSVGYKMTFGPPENRKSIAYATDIGKVTDTIRNNLRGCESVIVESNHDPEMLLSGRYPYELKLRIKSDRGHLSNSECAGLLSYLTENGTKNIMLAHLSEENNLPELAYNECFSAIADKNVNIYVASPNNPTQMNGDVYKSEMDLFDEIFMSKSLSDI